MEPEHPLETESRRLQATLARLTAQIKQLREQELPKFRAWQERHRRELDAVQRALARLEGQLKPILAHPLTETFITGAQALPSRSTIQWPRKVMHAAMGLVAVWLFQFSPFPHGAVMIVSTVFVVLVVGLEITRLKNAAFNAWVVNAMRAFMREEERTRPTAALYYTLSMYIVAVVFPLPVMVLTLLFIALGDTAASLVGVRWGRTRLSAHSSLEGSFACFATCYLAARTVPYWVPHFMGSITLFALLAGLVGAVAEAVFPKWDDNLVMPLVSAPALWVLVGIFS